MALKRAKVIAEVGNTHEGSFGLAKCFIKEAAACGADAVKFQTHIFAAESTKDAPVPPYFKSESREQYFTRTSFTREQYVELKAYAEQECKIEFMSSPFSIEALHFLTSLGMQTLKIPSGEVSNIPLLEEAARSSCSIILSSGMSHWAELDLAVKTLQDNNCKNLTLLQCTSEYPCPPEQVGFNIMLEMKSKYGLPVGLSDHTMGSAIPLAAIALGATIIEKHFTLSTKMYGSDAMHSMEPQEFTKMVQDIRAVEEAVKTHVDKDAMAASLENMKMIFEKSIVAKRAIKSGSTISYDDIAFKKPGSGISAARYHEFLGKKIKCDLSEDEQLQWHHIDREGISK